MSEGRTYRQICSELQVDLHDLVAITKRFADRHSNAVAMQIARCELQLETLKSLAKLQDDQLLTSTYETIANSVKAMKRVVVSATSGGNEAEDDKLSTMWTDIDFLVHVVSEIEREAGIRKSAQLHALNDKEVRQKVWELTGGRCTYCDCQLENGGTVGASFVVEHVVPRSCGGPDNIANYVPACASCNNSKGDRHVLQFIQTKMDRRRPPLTVVPLPVAAAE